MRQANKGATTRWAEVVAESVWPAHFNDVRASKATATHGYDLGSLLVPDYSRVVRHSPRSCSLDNATRQQDGRTRRRPGKRTKGIYRASYLCCALIDAEGKSSCIDNSPIWIVSRTTVGTVENIGL